MGKLKAEAICRNGREDRNGNKAFTAKNAESADNVENEGDRTQKFAGAADAEEGAAACSSFHPGRPKM